MPSFSYFLFPKKSGGDSQDGLKVPQLSGNSALLTRLLRHDQAGVRDNHPPMREFGRKTYIYSPPLHLLSVMKNHLKIEAHNQLRATLETAELHENTK